MRQGHERGVGVWSAESDLALFATEFVHHFFFPGSQLASVGARRPRRLSSHGSVRWSLANDFLPYGGYIGYAPRSARIERRLRLSAFPGRKCGAQSPVPPAPHLGRRRFASRGDTVGLATAVTMAPDGKSKTASAVDEAPFMRRDSWARGGISIGHAPTAHRA